MSQHQNEQKQDHKTEELISDNNGETHLVFFKQEEEELVRLLSKEQDQNLQNATVLATLVKTDNALSLARTESIEWLVKVNNFYGFSSVTALLAINYLDQIIITQHFQNYNPWIFQLLAVTCISLAAKVEEIHVPLLLDLQIEGCKFIFEAKTVQRMELLVLNVLRWKMNPVTPVLFLGIISEGIVCNRGEFFRRCERIFLSLVSDSRSVGFVPSEMAVSAMVIVVEEMEDCNFNPLDFQDRLLNSLKITKERVTECCNVIAEIEKRQEKANRSGKKRKEQVIEEEEKSTRTSSSSEESESEIGSPNGVMEANFSCESSDDSWGDIGTVVLLSAPDSPSCSSKRTKL